VRRYFGIMKISLSLPAFHSQEFHWYFLTGLMTTIMVAKWWFSNVTIIPSASISYFPLYALLSSLFLFVFVYFESYGFMVAYFIQCIIICYYTFLMFKISQFGQWEQSQISYCLLLTFFLHWAFSYFMRQKMPKAHLILSLDSAISKWYIYL
jgi:hypothetical protein